MADIHKGTCFCGAVEVTVTGKPEAMGYCHCASCRSWSAGPVNAFTLWKHGNVLVSRGADKLASYNKSPNSTRQWCKVCGGHVMTDHPEWGITDVYAATLPGVAFTPMLHVNYAETVLRMQDGLPKMKDFPADLGGSGATVAE